MFAAVSLLLLVALEGTTTTGNELQDSDLGCLLQKKAVPLSDTTYAPGPDPNPISDTTFRPTGIPDSTFRPTGIPDSTFRPTGIPDSTFRPTGIPDSTFRPTGIPDSTFRPTPGPDPNPADAEGDPHIKTLDGHHYTLLKQGTFSLWHFSDAEVQGNKVPADWQIYAHYSGSQSFTKGLLLVDKSGGSVKQVLELTAQDCEWKARSSKDDWKAVGDEAIAVEHAGTELLVSKSAAKGHHVRMKVKTQKGETEVAVLSLSCRPHHSINLELLMRNRADHRFVDGELRTGRRDFSKLAMLQTSTSQDAQFEVKDSWQSLGGSEQAALYLENQGMAAGMSFLSMPCTNEAENAAKKTCSKHLGDVDKDQTVFQDCVFDLCHGADETVAELAAELRDSTRAI